MSSRFRDVSKNNDDDLPLVSNFYIRANSPSAFRSGQWAKVVEVAWLSPGADREPKPVYVVEFIDGKRDLWPVYDETHQFEFTREPT